MLLCASDLTPRSDHAVLRTALLARQMNTKALFLHAVGGLQSGRVIRMKVNRARARLLSQSERAMLHAPQDAEVSVRLGKPLPVIAAAAAEWNPELIVMAAPRRRRLDFVIGTTAERVLRATRRCALIVSGAATHPYQNVVVTTDLSQPTSHVARTVAGLGLLDNDYTWLVNAFEPPYQGKIAMQGQVDGQLAQYKRVWRETAGREVTRELAREGVDAARVYVTAEPAHPFAAIERVLELAQPELLVIGVSRWVMLERLFFGSVADEVLRKVNCDILAISPPANRKAEQRAALITGTDVDVAAAP